MLKKVATILLAILSMTCALAEDVQPRIADVATLKGQRVNQLLGMGLVVGLNGTGDGDQSVPTMRMLAQGMAKFGSPVGDYLEDLKGTKNVAIVWVTATIPDTGVREGDRIDIQIATQGACKSLVGGRLLPCPLAHPDPNVERIFAMATGRIIVADEENATSGTINNGAVMEEDVLINYLAKGRELPFTDKWIKPDQQYVTLVLDDESASWGLAREVQLILDSALSLSADVAEVARAMDPKNIVVMVPERQNPASWISNIMELKVLMPEAQARVVVNRTTETIVVSGDATISPVVVSQKGLTVTVMPGADGTPQYVGPQTFVPLDPDRAGGTSVQELLNTLNRLAVPMEDRIAILTEVHRMGKLHAKLIVEE